MSATFVAQWPVQDDQQPMSVLIAGALADLPRLTTLHAVELLGEPAWTTSEVAGRLFLDLRVPARTLAAQ